MRGFNKAILIGNLTGAPELRYTQSKKGVATFTVASNRTWKDKEGKTQEDADFLRVVTWGATAENCERYLSKGSPVLVEGRIQSRSYDDKQGNKRYITEIVAQNVTFLGTKSDSSGGGEKSSGGGQKQGNFASARDKGFDEEEFPMDISEEVDAENEEEEVDIPF